MQGGEFWGLLLYGVAMAVGIPLLLVRMQRERRRAAIMLSELLTVAGARHVQLKQRAFRTGPIPRESYTIAFYYHILFQDRQGVSREGFAIVRRTGLFGYRGPLVAGIVNPDGTELNLEIDPDAGRTTSH